MREAPIHRRKDSRLKIGVSMTKEGLGRQPRFHSAGAQIEREYSQACTDFSTPPRPLVWRGVSLCVGCYVCVCVGGERAFLFIIFFQKEERRRRKTAVAPRKRFKHNLEVKCQPRPLPTPPTPHPLTIPIPSHEEATADSSPELFQPLHGQQIIMRLHFIFSFEHSGSLQ